MTTAPRASRAGNHTKQSSRQPKEFIGVESLPFEALQGWDHWSVEPFEENAAFQAVKAANWASAKVISHSVGQALAYLRQYPLPR